MIDVTTKGVLPGIPDCSPAFNGMIAAGCDGEWYDFPAGRYNFATPVNPLSKRVKITGRGTAMTYLVCNYQLAPFAGFIQNNQQTILEDCGIVLSGGLAGGCGVRITQNGIPPNPVGGSPASYSRLVNLIITEDDQSTGGMWDCAVMIDSNAPLGLRMCVLEDCLLLASRSHIFWGINCQGLVIRGGGMYPAGGIVNHAVIQQSSDGNDYRSAMVRLEGVEYLETLYLYGVQGARIDGMNTQVVCDSACNGIFVPQWVSVI
jgi:hypothetical protein